MKPDFKIVTEIPVKEIWDNDLLVSKVRRRYLKEKDIRELLRQGNVQFIVAKVGYKLKWISENECFSFWKKDVKIHLADPNKKHFLEDFPGEYFYFASEWESKSVNSIILLEMHH